MRGGGEPTADDAPCGHPTRRWEGMVSKGAERRGRCDQDRVWVPGMRECAEAH